MSKSQVKKSTISIKLEYKKGQIFAKNNVYFITCLGLIAKLSKADTDATDGIYISEIPKNFVDLTKTEAKTYVEGRCFNIVENLIILVNN